MLKKLALAPFLALLVTSTHAEPVPQFTDAVNIDEIEWENIKLVRDAGRVVGAAASRLVKEKLGQNQDPELISSKHFDILRGKREMVGGFIGRGLYEVEAPGHPRMRALPLDDHPSAVDDTRDSAKEFAVGVVEGFVAELAGTDSEPSLANPAVAAEYFDIY